MAESSISRRTINTAAYVLPTYDSGTHAINNDDGVRIITRPDGSKHIIGILQNDSNVVSNSKIMSLPDTVSYKVERNGYIQGWTTMTEANTGISVVIRINGNSVYLWGRALTSGLWCIDFIYT